MNKPNRRGRECQVSRILRELARKTQHYAKEVLHFGRLGSVASRRGFLKRERKKLLLKLGEKCHERLAAGKLSDPVLERMVGPLEKIEKLLAESDYGGSDGRQFTRPPGRGKTSRRKGRK